VRRGVGGLALAGASGCSRRTGSAWGDAGADRAGRVVRRCPALRQEAFCPSPGLSAWGPASAPVQSARSAARTFSSAFIHSERVPPPLRRLHGQRHSSAPPGLARSLTGSRNARRWTLEKAKVPRSGLAPAADMDLDGFGGAPPRLYRPGGRHHLNYRAARAFVEFLRNLRCRSGQNSFRTLPMASTPTCMASFDTLSAALR
jgi:hypothetical protein